MNGCDPETRTFANPHYIKRLPNGRIGCEDCGYVQPLEEEEATRVAIEKFREDLKAGKISIS